jgi:Cu/Ag efflux pump CusA
LSWRGNILNQKPLLWETGVGSDVMKPIAGPIVGGMITLNYPPRSREIA